jgi:hypothetical protein
VHLGDGNYAGVYQRPDAELLTLEQMCVEEMCDAIITDWAWFVPVYTSTTLDLYALASETIL